MDAPQGRREAHKQATREALSDAAKRLFAEQGYEATTVRDIAAAAGVTERTFYRYFGDKSGLLAEELIDWLRRLGEEIVARPAAESDLEAIEAALLKLARRRARDSPPPPWLGQEPRRTFELIRPSIPRPLERIERSIATAVEERAAAQGRKADEFGAIVLARVSLAIVRNALLQVRDEGGAKPGRLITLLRRGFAVVRDL